jgi:hypothetical protein
MLRATTLKLLRRNPGFACYVEWLFEHDEFGSLRDSPLAFMPDDDIFDHFTRVSWTYYYVDGCRRIATAYSRTGSTDPSFVDEVLSGLPDRDVIVDLQRSLLEKLADLEISFDLELGVWKKEERELVKFSADMFSTYLDSKIECVPYDFQSLEKAPVSHAVDINSKNIETGF